VLFMSNTFRIWHDPSVPLILDSTVCTDMLVANLCWGILPTFILVIWMIVEARKKTMQKASSGDAAQPLCLVGNQQAINVSDKGVMLAAMTFGLTVAVLRIVGVLYNAQRVPAVMYLTSWTLQTPFQVMFFLLLSWSVDRTTGIHKSLPWITMAFWLLYFNVAAGVIDYTMESYSDEGSVSFDYELRENLGNWIRPALIAYRTSIFDFRLAGCINAAKMLLHSACDAHERRKCVFSATETIVRWSCVAVAVAHYVVRPMAAHEALKHLGPIAEFAHNGQFQWFTNATYSTILTSTETSSVVIAVALVSTAIVAELLRRRRPTQLKCSWLLIIVIACVMVTGLQQILSAKLSVLMSLRPECLQGNAPKMTCTALEYTLELSRYSAATLPIALSAWFAIIPVFYKYGKTTFTFGWGSACAIISVFVIASFTLAVDVAFYTGLFTKCATCSSLPAMVFRVSLMASLLAAVLSWVVVISNTRTIFARCSRCRRSPTEQRASLRLSAQKVSYRTIDDDADCDATRV